MNKFKLFLATIAGSSLLPGPHGTWGSAAAVLLLGAIGYFCHLSGGAWQGLLLCGLVVFAALSLWLGPWAERRWSGEDPGRFVLDEGAGVCLTWLGVPLDGRYGLWGAAAVVFLAFRLFDVIKLPPARQLERLHGGWGILLDDLAAAVYANVLCQLLLRWL